MPQLTSEQIEQAKAKGVSQEQIDRFIASGSVIAEKKATFPAQIGQPIKEPIRAVGNIPSSAFQFIKGLISGIAQTPGVLAKKIPEQFGELAIEKGGIREAAKATVKEIPGSLAQIIPESARALFKGDTERAEKLIVEDPVGQILPWIIAGKMAASAAGKGAQFDAAISATARPVINAAKTSAGTVAQILGKGATAGLGVLTGTGRIPLQEAFKAGRETGGVGVFKETPFSQALRGKKDPNAIVREATDAIEILKNQRGDAYRSSLAKIQEQKQGLDISNVFKTRDSVLKKYNITEKDGNLDFTRSTIGRADAINDVKGIVELLKDWGTRAGDRTPAAMDILKRKLDDFYSDSSQARALVTEVKSSVKSVLNKQVDGYSKMTSSYEKMSQLLDDMKQGLSLGGRAGADTILRKLSSTMRADNDLRTQLLNQLETMSGVELTQQISGATLTGLPAKGLIGRGIQAGAGFSVLAGLLSPQILISLLFTSPRVVGEFLQALGASATQTQKMLNALNELRPILSPDMKK